MKQMCASTILLTEADGTNEEYKRNLNDPKIYLGQIVSSMFCIDLAVLQMEKMFPKN